jgi:NAD(P)-dependent dehydrogenase (short-subunit alcohol dehydrogenase family)
MVEGKIALVTGAASGIGRATAIAFAREGAKVVVDDINVEGGEETVRMIQGAGGEAIFVKGDVRVAAEVEALIHKTVETYGRLDCAHNNAGIIGELAFSADCTEENWDDVMATDLKGVWLCMKYEIPQMLKQGSGVIVNTASAGALTGLPFTPAYCAAKAGVSQLTKTAALEYAEHGIRINAVLPGGTRTPLLRAFTKGDPSTETMRAQKIPLGRLAEPEDIADAVVWLCSDGARFVTGNPMLVDGGMVAGQPPRRQVKMA